MALLDLINWLCLLDVCVRVRAFSLSQPGMERGTFSSRHAVIHDQKTAERYVPLQHISSNQKPGSFAASNSSLSEFGIMGFELGYALENPNSPCLLGGTVRWFRQRCSGNAQDAAPIKCNAVHRRARAWISRQTPSLEQPFFPYLGQLRLLLYLWCSKLDWPSVATSFRLVVFDCRCVQMIDLPLPVNTFKQAPLMQAASLAASGWPGMHVNAMVMKEVSGLHLSKKDTCVYTVFGRPWQGLAQ